MAWADDDPDSRCVVDACTLAEGLVRFDCSSEGALRIDGEGQRAYFVVVGEFLCELAQNRECGYSGLVGEDLIAVFVTESFGFAVEPAGVDGCLLAPCVVREREVMPDPGNLVLTYGLTQQRIDVAADGTLHVSELDDGNADTSGWLEGGGVTDLGRAGCGLSGGGGQEAEGKKSRGSESGSEGSGK